MDDRHPPPVDDRDALFHWVLGLLRGLLLEREAFVVLALPDNHFVQALVDEHGDLQIESVSDEYLLDGATLGVEREALLRHLGWHPPSEHSPNWHRTFVDAWPPPTAVAAEFLTLTLLAVHGLGPDAPQVKHARTVPGVRVQRCDERCAA